MRDRELSYGWVMVAVGMAVAAAIVLQTPWLALLAPAALILFYILPKPEWLLYALLLSIPFSSELQITPSLGTDLPDEGLMWLCSVMVVFVMYRERARLATLVSHPVVACILLSWLWSWISLAFAESPWLALKFILAKSWYLLPFLFGTMLILNDPKRLRIASVLIVMPMILLAAITLVRHANTGFDFADVSNVVWPYFRNHVNYGALLVCTLPPAYLFWRRKKSPGWFLAILLLITALYFSYSRGAWLALAAGIIAPWLLRKRLLVMFAITVPLCLAMVVYWLREDNNYLRFRPDFESTIYHADLAGHMQATYRMKDLSTAERFYRWIAAERIWEDHPVTGVGPNHFVAVYRSYTVEAFRTYVSDNPERSTVHNYLLLLLAEQGLPGLLLFLFTLLAMAITAQRVYHTVSDRFTGLLVQCVVSILAMILVLISLSDLVETDKIGPLFYTCAGVLVVASLSAYVQRVPESVTEKVEG